MTADLHGHEGHERQGRGPDEHDVDQVVGVSVRHDQAVARRPAKPANRARTAVAAWMKLYTAGMSPS